jgi:DNA adenine methylase
VRYLGGKSRLAKHIVAAISEQIGDAPIWEPFCGGLSVTVELAKSRDSEVIASDVHPALISLYKACQSGWTPPEQVTREMYTAAKRWPDDDPLKAFIGFGCSFAGKWFGGGSDETLKALTRASRSSLLRQFRYLPNVTFKHLNFLEMTPCKLANAQAIYCDPPYEGTTGYGTGAFDHALFWRRTQEWADRGVRVFVSEFQCPVPHEVRWSIERKIAVTHGHGKVRVDSLYEVLPR